MAGASISAALSAAQAEVQSSSQALQIRQKFTDGILQSGTKRGEEVDRAKRAQLESELDAMVVQAKIAGDRIAMTMAGIGAALTMTGYLDKSDEKNAVKAIENNLSKRMQNADTELVGNIINSNPRPPELSDDAVNQRALALTGKSPPAVPTETERVNAARTILLEGGQDLRDRVMYQVLDNEIKNNPNIPEGVRTRYNNAITELRGSGLSREQAVQQFFQNEGNVGLRMEIYEAVNNKQPNNHSTLLNRFATDSMNERQKTKDSTHRYDNVTAKLMKDLEAITKAQAQLMQHQAELRKARALASANQYAAASLQ